MNRFMGMMPFNEVEIEKVFKVGAGQLQVTLQSGKNGWTIIYADSSTESSDVVDTSENNFNKALKVLKTHFYEVNEVDDGPGEEMREEMSDDIIY